MGVDVEGEVQQSRQARPNKAKTSGSRGSSVLSSPQKPSHRRTWVTKRSCSTTRAPELVDMQALPPVQTSVDVA